MVKKRVRKKPAKKRGRPATGHQRQRQFRASEEQWSRWQAVAEAAGLTRAEWIRQTLDRATERPS